ncbi:hypothetical protein OZN62_01540 [Aurantiacibacter sp. MUD11]|uniref:hypothetical protein n=1 Tax=Aurantiacibacter sp. MUD11 TaxID=3003265 RepID=UPI0022AB47EB|nr:hypothetical protein [Aurantiacibacter sp. MUD11]WAT18286.1 hypothetical protein OZN62_01540 [Aurantiacibacter sp. MUD11]
MRTPALALPLLLVLGGCQAEIEPAPTPTPTNTGPRTLVSAGLNDQQLGPRIVGPQGPEVVSTVTFEGSVVAEITSFVTCPATPEGETAPEECVPEDQPEGTVYTYVHRVVPAEGAGPVASFRTSRRATGFANVIGFNRVQATGALGEDYSIGVQIDNGALIWRIEAGDGWDAGEEITLFWQSTLPPAGPEEAYLVETADGMVAATGPFPPEPEESAGEAPAGD